MIPNKSRNRLEAFLAFLSGQSAEVPTKPRNKLEHYLLFLCGLSEAFPAKPSNRLEFYLDYLCKHRSGGGGDITLETLNVSENGTTNAPSGKAYNKVVTNVQPTGTKQVSIPQNGTTTENVAGYASVEIAVNVPNSYAAGDEGKVVSSGALVSQTAHAQVTQNGTIDTTLNNSVEVAVPGIRKVTGSFTILTRNLAPNIVHNLGTKKVACIIYPASQVNATQGYDNFYSDFFNANELIPSDDWLLDFSSYNSNFSGVATVTKADRDQYLKVGAEMASPWGSQNEWWKATNHTTETDSERIVSDNELSCGTVRWAPGTYAYIVYAFE